MARPTITDVARIVGVSPSTVSRALSSNSTRVSASTRAAIVAAAQEIGYVPNGAARELVTGRSNSIGVVIPDTQNPYYSSILKGVQIEAQVEGLKVVVADFDEDVKAEHALVERFQEQVDGIMLCSSRLSDDQLRHFAAEVPLVLVSRQLDDIPSASTDQRLAMRLAIEHLYALGHRRIGYARGPEISWSNQQRRDAIPQIAEQLDGLVVSEFGPFSPMFESGAPAADLAVASGATALIACNDLVAMGAMSRLRRRGIAVPEQLSIVGIDDSVSATLVHPALTSVYTPDVRLGRTATDVMVDVLQGGRPAPIVDSLDIELHIRESTAPINVAASRPHDQVSH